MRKKLLDLAFMLVGGIGAVTLSIIAILDNQAADLVSVIPATMVCCSMFVAGYLSYSKEK